MNNQQKLEFILNLERKAKRKRQLIGFLLIGILGALIIFAQFMNHSVA